MIQNLTNLFPQEDTGKVMSQRGQLKNQNTTGLNGKSPSLLEGMQDGQPVNMSQQEVMQNPMNAATIQMGQNMTMGTSETGAGMDASLTNPANIPPEEIGMALATNSLSVNMPESAADLNQLPDVHAEERQSKHLRDLMGLGKIPPRENPSLNEPGNRVSVTEPQATSRVNNSERLVNELQQRVRTNSEEIER